ANHNDSSHIDKRPNYYTTTAISSRTNTIITTHKQPPTIKSPLHEITTNCYNSQL
ncbi:Hypothetical predicted protein, partial [Olea europaea subsp. europaea]